VNLKHDDAVDALVYLILGLLGEASRVRRKQSSAIHPADV